MRIVTALFCLALAACAQTATVAQKVEPPSAPLPRLEVMITPDVEKGEVAARGEPARGYRWERVADMPDGACNVWGVLPRN